MDRRDPVPPSGWELIGSYDGADIWARDPLGHVHEVYWFDEEKYPREHLPPQDMFARLIVVGFGVDPATSLPWSGATLRAAYHAAPAYMKVDVEPWILADREDRRGDSALVHICAAETEIAKAYGVLHQMQCDAFNRADRDLGKAMTACDLAWEATRRAKAAVQGYRHGLVDYPLTAQSMRVLAAADAAASAAARGDAA